MKLPQQQPATLTEDGNPPAKVETWQGLLKTTEKRDIDY